MTRMKALTLALAGTLALGAGATLSADRALLIGVGKYQMDSANLPGIDLDIGMMKEAAESLGFAPANIKVLLDQDATASNVKSTMESWLVNGAGPGDRVLIYYSGHGAPVPDENGDEDDNADETITMHDLAITRRNGKSTLSGVLLDDDFGRILGTMRSRNVLVLVDACHSGTATKSLKFSTRSLGVSGGVSKSFEYKDMPLTSRSFKVESRTNAGGGSYVAISAAADSEKSIATSRGSVFTLGIRDAVMKGKESGVRSLTPRKLWQAASAFVNSALPADRQFHPQINGNPALMDQPIMLAVTSEGRGPVWRKVEQLADGSGGVRIVTDKSTFSEGEKMVMKVQVPEEGYLNIVNVGPDDVPIVLYSNQHHQDNRVSAGTVTLPTADMSFDLVAREPYGASLLVAVVTKKPINLFKTADAERDEKGNIKDLLGRLSEDGMSNMRAWKVESRKSSDYQAGKLETRICRTASSCN